MTIEYTSETVLEPALYEVLKRAPIGGSWIEARTVVLLSPSDLGVGDVGVWHLRRLIDGGYIRSICAVADLRASGTP